MNDRLFLEMESILVLCVVKAIIEAARNFEAHVLLFPPLCIYPLAPHQSTFFLWPHHPDKLNSPPLPFWSRCSHG